MLEAVVPRMTCVSLQRFFPFTFDLINLSYISSILHMATISELFREGVEKFAILDIEIFKKSLSNRIISDMTEVSQASQYCLFNILFQSH